MDAGPPPKSEAPQDAQARGYAERALEIGLVLAALALPLSEGAFQIACAISVLSALSLRRGRLGPTDRLSRAFLVALGLWIAIGASSAAIQGHAVRTSSLNYALMSFALVLGVELARFSDDARLRRLVWALLAGAALAAFVGVLQLLVGELPGEAWLGGGRVRGQRYIPGTRLLAATGTLQHRLKMSEAWLATLALVCALRAWGFPKRVVVTLSVAIFALIGTTYSKAAMGAAVIALGAWAVVVWAPRLARWVYAAAGIGIVSAVPVALWLGARTIPTMPVPKGSLEVRPWLWSLAHELFTESPVFGKGLGTYYFQAKPRVVSGYDVHSYGAHQELVTVAVETGVVGLVLFAAAIALGGLAILRAHETAASSRSRALTTFALLCFSAYAMLAMVHDFLFHPTTAILFWTAIGVGIGSRRPSTA